MIAALSEPSWVPKNPEKIMYKNPKNKKYFVNSTIFKLCRKNRNPGKLEIVIDAIT
jgi:hypothetical protein